MLYTFFEIFLTFFPSIMLNFCYMVKVFWVNFLVALEFSGVQVLNYLCQCAEEPKISNSSLGSWH